MGNVRPTYIKRVAEKLVAEFPDAFSRDFVSNKELLGRYTNIDSKVMRNRIAGYISTMMEQKQHKNEMQPEA
ncbi:MAG: 30S ribosomal protein S17e [Thermoplasmatota archaeon]